MLVLIIIMFYIGFIAVILAPANNEEDDIDSKEVKRVLVLVSILFALVMITLATDNIISEYLFALVSGKG